jgi:two-component system sensor histidine kinase/response regulator
MHFDGRLARMLVLPLADIPTSIEVWRERIHPDDLHKVVGAMNDHLRGLTPVYSVEYRMRNGQGRWHRVRCRGRVAERLEDGSPALVAGVQENLEPDTPSYLPSR